MGESFAQLFCRIALGVGFISADLDRLGFLGPAGTPGVSWGDMDHFFLYSKKLMYYFPDFLIQWLAYSASFAEMVFGISLLCGFLTRLTAVLSGILLLLFALTMTFSMGLHAPLSYSVYTASAAAFLLSLPEKYKWSMDSLMWGRFNKGF